LRQEKTEASLLIQIKEFEGDIYKKYLLNENNDVTQEKKFWREVKAFQRMEQAKVDFVPKLISFDDSTLTLHMEKIVGLTLTAFLENEGIQAYDSIVEQLVHIDGYLYDNKINYMYASPMDVIIQNKTGKLFIIDFEYTVLDEPYIQILCTRMFHERIERVRNEKNREIFKTLLYKRRHQFRRYYFRRLCQYYVSKVGCFPENRKKGTFE